MLHFRCLFYLLLFSLLRQSYFSLPCLLRFLLEQLYRLSVCDYFEVFMDYILQSGDQSLLYKLVEELEVLVVVAQDVAETVLDESLGEFHVVEYISKCDFRLNHPELSQMPRGVRVFSAESWAECIDITESAAVGFNVQLATNSQESRTPEEVLMVVNFLLLSFFSLLLERDLIEPLFYHSGNLEHLSCPFAVRRCDEWSVHIEEPFLLEVLVDSVS